MGATISHIRSKHHATPDKGPIHAPPPGYNESVDTYASKGPEKGSRGSMPPSQAETIAPQRDPMQDKLQAATKREIESFVGNSWYVSSSGHMNHFEPPIKKLLRAYDPSSVEYAQLRGQVLGRVATYALVARAIESNCNACLAMFPEAQRPDVRQALIAQLFAQTDPSRHDSDVIASVQAYGKTARPR